MNPSLNQYNQIQQPSGTPVQGSMMNPVSFTNNGVCISPPISQEDHGNLIPVNVSQSPTNGPHPITNLYTSPPISQMSHGNGNFFYFISRFFFVKTLKIHIFDPMTQICLAETTFRC